MHASVVQVGKSLKITIPVEIVNHIGLKKGDKDLLHVDDGHIVMEKKE
jgi:bifunctional DNA-binding transcriptional regulator/antitoxin component of YhaV-PrlF toxin-antitoxin module